MSTHAPSNKLEHLALRVSRLETHLGLNPIADEHLDLEPETDSEPASEVMEPTLLPMMDEPPSIPINDQSCSTEAAVTTTPPKAETEAAKAPEPQRIQGKSNLDWAPALLRSNPVESRDSVDPPKTAHQQEANKLSWRRFEIFVGAKAMAWAGALVVLLAVSFFMKMAYDNGWLALPPQFRIAIAYLFGAGLLVTGEVALRRLGRGATLALNGAGLGTLYLTTLAASHYFNLMSANTAMVLLACVSAVGLLITIRGRLMAIGALSLIGGYAAPLLLGSSSANPLALPLYTLALLSVGLVLAIRQDGVFARLRGVTMIAHGLVGGLWAVSSSASDWPIALGFLSTSCLLVYGAAVVFARREFAPIRNCVSVLAATTWLVSLGGWFIARIQPADQEWLGLFFAGVAVSAGIFATHFGTGLDALRRLPQTALDRLTLTFWAQLGVLTTIAIGMQFEGPALALGWLALALVTVELARHLPSRGVASFSLLVMTITGFRIFGWETQLDTPLWSGYGLTLTPWAMLAFSLAAVVLYAAQRLNAQRLKLEQALPAALNTAAVIMWVMTISMITTGLTTTTLWLVGAILLIGTRRWDSGQSYLPLGTLLLAATTGRWLIADTLLPRLNQTLDFSAQLPFWNPTFGLAVAIAAAGWWAFHANLARLRAVDRDANAKPNTNAGGNWLIEPTCIGTVFFLLFAFSMQLELAVGRLALADALGGRAPWHVLQLLLTLLWTIGGVLLGLLSGSLGAGRGRAVAKAAWAVVGICIAKWIVLDTLLYAISGHDGFVQADWPLGNLQMLVGIGLTGVIWLLVSQRHQHADSNRNEWLEWGRWMPVGAALLVLWGASFEVSRALHQYAAEALSQWGSAPLHVLSLCLLWAVGGLLMLYHGQRSPWRPLMAAGVTIVGVSAGAWLTIGTLYPLSLRGLVLTNPVLNVEFASGIGIALLLGLTLHSILKSLAKTGHAFEYNATRILSALLIFIGLWLGYFEIGRGFAPERLPIEHADMIRHLAWSVYTGLFAISLLMIGFTRRISALRYVGLGLLILTLGKVLIVDLSEVRLIFRVLSLLVTGLLFVGTSLLYAKRSAALDEPVQTADGPKATERPKPHASVTTE